MRTVYRVCAAALLLHAGTAAAQSGERDEARLRRPGERPNAARPRGATDVETAIDRNTRRALGERANVNGLTGVQGGNLVPNRRLNTRVLTRQANRLSTRIEGTGVGEHEVSDQTRDAAVTPRR